MNISEDKFKGWLLSKGLSSKTVKDYLYYFNRFFYDKFNQETVSDYLSKPSNSSKPSRAFLKNLSEYLRVNYFELKISDEELRNINSVEFPKISGRIKKREIKVIPLNHISLLEKNLPSEKTKLQMLLTFYCGLRLEEMMKVRVIDFKFPEWTKDKEKSGFLTIVGKGDKERTVPVPNFLMSRLIKYSMNRSLKIKEFSEEEFLFIDLNKGTKFDSIKRNWQKILREAGINAGITKLNAQGRVIGSTQIHPHMLRHTYASYLRTKGMDLKEIQELLGHSSIQSTQVYLHVDKEELNKKMEGIFNELQTRK